MSVVLIAQKLLESSHFLSATEEEGERWGQPQPASDNEGKFRLLSKGTPADFSYDGTATGDGSTTTMIDSALSMFGDDYFIGATITFTGGENTSGSATITDFDQATGTLTWSGAVNSTLTGDTFTLTVPFDTRNFKVELVTSGDAGDATFKWYHNGTYLGRDDPDQADWLGQQTLAACAPGGYYPAITETADGRWIAIYEDTSNHAVSIRSSDKGATWDSPVTIETSSVEISSNLVKLKSGRLLVCVQSTGQKIYYSDDNGDSWQSFDPANLTAFKMLWFVELFNGNLLVVSYNTTDYEIEASISINGGTIFSDPVTVFSPSSNNALHPTAVQAQDGSIICAFETDQDSVGDYEIKACKSADGGTSWGSASDIFAFSSVDFIFSALVKDINGDIFCAVSEYQSDQRIVFSKTTDHGDSWGSQSTLISEGGVDLSTPRLALLDGHILVCIYSDITNQDIEMVRRGMWEAYSANGCPCAQEAIAQHLICGAEIVWHGGSGESGDDWTFEAEYDYAMSNIIDDSPQRPWRSEQDNIDCSIVFWAGSTSQKLYVDSVAFFGCNVRSLKFQMNDSDSWGAPSVDETISFDLTTSGVLDAAANGNFIKDAALMASFKDHELRPGRIRYYVCFTSGNLDGYSFQIIDNIGDYIQLEGPFASYDYVFGPVATDDTFAIFQSHVAKTFTGGIYSHKRISITARLTSPSEGYYQLGAMVAGRAITLSEAFDIDYAKDHGYGVELIDTPQGGLIPIEDWGGPRRRFELAWSLANEGRREVLAFLDYIGGGNICLIPDSSDLTDCYLVKRRGDVSQQHWKDDVFSIGAEFIEVL